MMLAGGGDFLGGPFAAQNYSTSLADNEYPSYCVNSQLLSLGKIEKKLPNNVWNCLILKFNTSAANDLGQNISLHADKYSLRKAYKQYNGCLCLRSLVPRRSNIGYEASVCVAIWITILYGALTH